MFLEQQAIDYFHRYDGMRAFIRSPHSSREGDIPSRKTGANQEFEQYRDYVPGDDPRSVDWKVMARSDRLFVRSYGRDSAANVRLVLDCSLSMGYRGSAGDSKLGYACKLTALLFWLFRREKHRVRLSFLNDYLVHSAAETQEALEKELSDIRPEGITDFSAFKPASDRETVILITDGWGNDRGEAILSLLLHQVHVLQVLSREEFRLDLSGDMVLRGMEDGRSIHVVPSLVRDKYREIMATWVHGIRNRWKARGLHHLLFTTGKPYYATLLEYLESIGDIR